MAAGVLHALQVGTELVDLRFLRLRLFAQILQGGHGMAAVACQTVARCDHRLKEGGQFAQMLGLFNVRGAVFELLLVLFAVCAQLGHVVRVLRQQIFDALVCLLRAGVQLQVAKEQAFEVVLDVAQLGAGPCRGHGFPQFVGLCQQRRVLRTQLAQVFDRHVQQLLDVVRALCLLLANEGHAQAVVGEHLLQRVGVRRRLAQKIHQLQGNVAGASIFGAQHGDGVFDQACQCLGQAGGEGVQHLRG